MNIKKKENILIGLLILGLFVILYFLEVPKDEREFKPLPYFGDIEQAENEFLESQDTNHNR